MHHQRGALFFVGMKKILNYQLILLAVCCFMGKTTLAQSGSVSEKDAQKWVKSGDWRNGLTFKLFPDVDAVAFDKEYHQNKALWDEAFAWMKRNNLDTLSVGKYAIDGDKVFATITDGATTKEFEKTAWESHRKYTDLHMMIRGKEKIGMASVATATVTTPYSDTKDAANYTAEGKFYIAEPGTFYLFFPTNAHRPSIKVDGYDKVKKLVLKVKVAQ
jgi:biofilm protein TabA